MNAGTVEAQDPKRSGGAAPLGARPRGLPPNPRGALRGASRDPLHATTRRLGQATPPRPPRCPRNRAASLTCRLFRLADGAKPSMWGRAPALWTRCGRLGFGEKMSARIRRRLGKCRESGRVGKSAVEGCGRGAKRGGKGAGCRPHSTAAFPIPGGSRRGR